ncbi:MAG: ribbon-helix-helix domain-containing protein [Coriobacteriales bacterium]|nr:ribbon-helix-helix domain-containing protein [Coriobacteriales bacterium]
MDIFKVNRESIKISSINRTIRMKPEHFERLMYLSEETGVSFNRIVNQCIEFAFAHIIDEKPEP